MVEPASLDPSTQAPLLGPTEASDWGQLRILVVAHGYPPNQMAGAEQHMRRKVRWWRQHGHSVRVVTADPHLSREVPFGLIERLLDQMDGVDVYRLRFAVADGTRPLRETYFYPLLGPELVLHVEGFQPHIIYQLSGTIFGLHPLEIAAEYGIPSVLFATDFWHSCQRHTLLRPDGSCCPGPRHPSDCAACRLTARRPAAILGRHVQGLSWSLLAALQRTSAELMHLRTGGVRSFEEREELVHNAIATAGLVICNSRFLTDAFVGLGVDPGRILTIRQGMDDLPAPEARVVPRSDGPLRVLYLGQITRHKGVDLLAEAVSRLIEQGLEIELRIHGPVTDGVLKVDAGATGRVLVGHSLQRSEMFAALAQSDVLVVPSRWYENSPNVILEAQALGVPVITANHGGMAEMVRDGVDGLLYEPGDRKALEGALRRLALDRELLRRLAANAPRPHALSDEMTPEDQALARLVRVRQRSGVALG